MDAAAFEARRVKSHGRRRRVRTIGLVLVGLIVLAVALMWAVPFLFLVRDAARRIMIARLAYPQTPTVPGVYPVTAEKDQLWSEIFLRTPAMPLAPRSAPGTASAASLTFEVVDPILQPKRTEAPATVSMTIYGPPNTWRTHAGHVLMLRADAETLELGPSIEEYHGDGWGLKDRDRLDFSIPTEFFVRLATAKEAGGALDGDPFVIDAGAHAALRDFAAYLRPGVEVNPPK